MGDAGAGDGSFLHHTSSVTLIRKCKDGFYINMGIKNIITFSNIRQKNGAHFFSCVPSPPPPETLLSRGTHDGHQATHATLEIDDGDDDGDDGYARMDDDD